jgi:hypothetical protein
MSRWGVPEDLAIVVVRVQPLADFHKMSRTGNFLGGLEAPANTRQDLGS